MEESRIAFLQRLINSPSPSGFEQRVQQVIREEMQLYTDEQRTDVHGNVIAALNPNANPRVMLTAHCDELGFLVLQSVDSTLQPYLANECRFIPRTVLSWESLAANRYIYCKATSAVKLLSCQRCGSISASTVKKKRKN